MSPPEKTGKTMGPDKVHPRVLRELAEVAAKPLFLTFENSWQPGEVLSDWKKGNNTPSLKRGRRENYQPVSASALHLGRS